MLKRIKNSEVSTVHSRQRGTTCFLNIESPHYMLNKGCIEVFSAFIAYGKSANFKACRVVLDMGQVLFCFDGVWYGYATAAISRIRRKGV